MKRANLRMAALIAGIVLPVMAIPAMATDIRMTIWSANEAHLALFNEIAGAYTQAHPDVKVTFDSLPLDTYTTTLTTQIAGGNAPDLAWIFENSAGDFVSSGALAPFKATLAAYPGYELDDVSPSALSVWSADGDIYAYPFSTSPFGIFVNNDVIRAAGQKTPAELIAAGEWNWDNANAVNTAVAASGKQGLIVRDFDYKIWDQLAAIWLGWGAAPWSADGKTCTFTDKPMLDAMSFIHKAIFTDKSIPGPGIAADFFAGDAAMTITQISRASLLPKENGFDWDLVPLPSGPAGEYAMIGQAGIGVLASGKNVDVAKDFLAFFTSPENSKKLSRFFPPPRNSQLTAEVLGATNPLLSAQQIEAVVIKGISIGQVRPSHSGFAEIQQTVRSELDALWEPNADVAAVMASVCARIQPML